MTNQFHHGITVQDGDIVRPFRTSATNVIGICGTAGKGPVNEPVLITSFTQAQQTFGLLANDGFTLLADLKDIFDQGNFLVVAVNVASRDTLLTVSNESVNLGSTEVGKTSKNFISALTVSDTIASIVELDGAGEFELPTGLTSLDAVKSVDGLVTYDDTDDYLVSGNTISAVPTGLLSARDSVLIEYTATLVEGSDFSYDADTGNITKLAGLLFGNATIEVSYSHVNSAVSDSDIIGVEGATSEDNTGLYVFLKAVNALGVTTKLISAPSSNSHVLPVSGTNAIVTSLLLMSEKLGAIAITNTPEITANALTFRNIHKDKRLFAVNTWQYTTIEGVKVKRNMSAYTAALFAKSDATRPESVAASPSNTKVNGVTELVNPVEFNLVKSGTQADLLNENGIAVYINVNGFRLWGNRSTTDDTAFSFVNVIRVSDYIKDAIANSHLEMIDQNITQGFIQTLLTRINLFLGRQRNIGILNYGKAYANPELNTPTAFANGKVYIDYEIGIPGIAENIIFTANVVNGYVTNIEEAN